MNNSPQDSSILDQAMLAVNVLTVERALMLMIGETRAFPIWEKIHYGVLEPNEIGTALSLCDASRGRCPRLLCLEFALWGRSTREEELQTWFNKLPNRLLRSDYTAALEGGTRILFHSLEAPLGVVYENERLLGVKVLNAILFLQVELDVMECCFHADDAPQIDELAIEERRLPLVRLEKSMAQYLSLRLRMPVEVELDSLSSLRRKSGAELRLRVHSLSFHPKVLAERFPIFKPEFPDREIAPQAIIPEAVTDEYLILLCVF